MGLEMALQIGIVILTLSIFYLLHTFPLTKKLQSKSRASAQAKRHFVSGAQLLSRARSTRNRSISLSLSQNALLEADKALLIDPNDAASHILKALALDQLGGCPSALKSLDTALTKKGSNQRSLLSDSERGEALLKRAEIRFAVKKRRRVDDVINDVAEAVRLGAGSGKAYCLLEECYEVKGMREEARDAFQEALRVEPGSVLGRQGLEQNI